MQYRKDRWQYIMVAVLMVVLALAMVGIPGGAGFSAVSPAIAAGSLSENATYGYVGIGAAPSTTWPLRVYGKTAIFQGPADPAGLIIQRTATNRWALVANETALGKGFSIARWNSGAIQGVSRLFIDLAGRVGINTIAPDPASKLNVYSDNTTYPNLAVYGQTKGGYTYGVGGTNDALQSIGFMGGSYKQGSLVRGIGAFGSAYGKSGSLGTPNEGVYGYNGGSGNAGYFQGNVQVTGILSAGGKLFKIDHPLDPDNKYLQHASVESPEMMNIYNGNIVLDSKGEAVVQLPAYFQALNKDFRYQLTCIGGAAMVYVAREIADNNFKIAGGKPGLKVSWQVTGVRHDTWAEANPVQVELEKSKATSNDPALQPAGEKQGWAEWGNTPPAMSQ